MDGGWCWNYDKNETKIIWQLLNLLRMTSCVYHRTYSFRKICKCVDFNVQYGVIIGDCYKRTCIEIGLGLILNIEIKTKLYRPPNW